MGYAKLFIRFIAVISLIPSISVSAISKPNSNGSYYVSAHYNPTLCKFFNFEIAEAYQKTILSHGYKTDSSVVNELQGTNFNVSNFQFNYKDNLLLAFSSAVGYKKNNGSRIEFEVGYEKFNTKTDTEYQNEDAYKIIALKRSSYLQHADYITVKIDAITTVSLMANLCYDLHISKVVPYACAGIGSNIVHITQNYVVPKFSYQAKAGINFSVNPKTSIFLGGFYHSILDKTYNGIPANMPKNLFCSFNGVVATFDLSYFGGEVGVRFIL
ncbi:P44/Msp2 family outer membrane protein [Candidatus Neoehrlichia procyonis]|uniref:Surface antigen family protein n=1 Tax=Candidatus Neoehrlichia procyonis str. RAC413 TaxID=1359163 RepID=A0A0F3NNR9_9RICK|nr:P44/Msp2 family outer membrane protein [Candidatus Neoehrlichia lotoris]KJV69416.1 surface antigen family protein [Candidatus Neoehrlichia lotoris str. RAC413]